MIKASYRDGVFQPEEPVPPEWSEGQKVRVEWEFDEPSDDPEQIETWVLECQRTGLMHFEPGEREQLRQALDEADAVAKAQVRRRMESQP